VPKYIQFDNVSIVEWSAQNPNARVTQFLSKMEIFFITEVPL